VSSKITLSQSDMVKAIQFWFTRKLFKPSACPVVTKVEANVDAVNGADSFDVDVDPPAAKPAVAPKTGFTPEQAAMIAATADVPVTLAQP
jgi:hypothetical protein